MKGRKCSPLGLSDKVTGIGKFLKIIETWGKMGENRELKEREKE